MDCTPKSLAYTHVPTTFGRFASGSTTRNFAHTEVVVACKAADHPSSPRLIDQTAGEIAHRSTPSPKGTPSMHANVLVMDRPEHPSKPQPTMKTPLLIATTHTLRPHKLPISSAYVSLGKTHDHRHAPYSWP